MRFVFVFLIVCCVGNSNAQSYYIHTIDSLAAEIESKVGLSVLKEVWGGINNDSTHNIYFVDSANRVHKMTLSRSLDSDLDEYISSFFIGKFVKIDFHIQNKKKKNTVKRGAYYFLGDNLVNIQEIPPLYPNDYAKLLENANQARYEYEVHNFSDALLVQIETMVDEIDRDSSLNEEKKNFSKSTTSFTDLTAYKSSSGEIRKLVLEMKFKSGSRIDFYYYSRDTLVYGRSEERLNGQKSNTHTFYFTDNIYRSQTASWKTIIRFHEWGKTYLNQFDRKRE